MFGFKKFTVSKQRDTARHLDWLKSVKESHGSVELSSLSFATAINERGVYSITAQNQKKVLYLCYFVNMNLHLFAFNWVEFFLLTKCLIKCNVWNIINMFGHMYINTFSLTDQHGNCSKTLCS